MYIDATEINDDFKSEKTRRDGFEDQRRGDKRDEVTQMYLLSDNQVKRIEINLDETPLHVKLTSEAKVSNHSLEFPANYKTEVI